MSRVLVLHATRHGSTEQIARAIATAAVAEGADVHLLPAGSFRRGFRTVGSG
ncbi:hypothetical protein ODJ79_37495 [Actinoplanes sp. KI2]|uniref:hypothetical protein n=1 Tax=Actinoplanes sp. KI2 TaxID=2983315 RepID=UPI0021D579B0|nr:hypothetical protein [Actinoplanes sp. KI2]MCU7729444.1 hypothetical protein [Actinoplanes sp. KI2]